MPQKRFLKAKMLVVMLLMLQVAHAQLKTISGKITDENGKPIPNTNVQASGAKTVQTANNGTFLISVPASTASLLITNAAFRDTTIDVNDKTTIAVTLTSKVNTLADVVVNIGYGTQKAKDVTGAIGSVKGAAIKDLPVQNVAEVLQGRVAGVDVTQSTGEAGASTSQITIRGVSSLNQGNPLYIIDGVRQATNSVGPGADPASNINPADIASIEVLKDASATAIYGAAAAGGVIIITTKKGHGAPNIDFNARYGITTPKVLQLLDRNDFIKARDLINDPSYLGNTDIDTFPNTNWVNAIFNDGSEQNYNLSISGSTPAINYYMSGVYNDQQGVYLNNSSSMYGFKLNTDITVSDHIKIGEQIDAYQRSTAPVDYSLDNSSIQNARGNPPFLTVPTMSIYGKTPGTWGNNPPGFIGPNIVGEVLTKNRNITQDNIVGNVYGEVKLPAALTFRATLGYTIFNEQGNDYEGTLQTPVDAVTQPKLFKDFVSYKNLLNAYTLAHDKSYGKNNVNALIGYEQYQGLYNAVYASENNVLGSSYAFLPSSTTVNTIASGGYDPNPLVESVFGRINYNYNEKYYASASIRRDADYIHFSSGNPAGIFPAGSVGWKISDEHFFKKERKIFNFLKLRASYGSVGNSNIPAYTFVQGYIPTSAQNFAPNAPYVLNYSTSSVASTNIKWETTNESNIGVDGELEEGKINFSIDWYTKTTKDLLYAVPLAPSSGYTQFITNIGSVKNTGVDILIGYKNHYKELNYNVTLTGSFNTNKVVDLGGINGNPLLDGNNALVPDATPPTGAMSGQALTYTNTGYPFGQFYGLKVLGIYKTDQQAISRGVTQFGIMPHAGDLIYAKLGSNKTNNVTYADDTTIGNPYPKFTFGLNIALSWKGWDVAMLWNGALGVQIYNGVAPYSENLFSDGNTTSKIFGASNFNGNGITSQPNVFYNGIQDNPGTGGNGNYYHSSSYFVENGNYVKLKNLQVGYTFSTNLLRKVNIKSARVFIMTNNVFTITKYSGIDPEIGSQSITTNSGTTSRGIDSPFKYPYVKTFSMGIDLKF